MSDFWLTEYIPHLVVQPADARLNPPEGYLFVQDGLIISCGVLYALLYVFLMMRVVKDGVLPGSIKFLSLTLAYELYYAFATTSTRLERICFLVWFELDLAFVALALWRVHGPDQGKRIAGEMLVYCITALAGLRYLGYLYPDDREQITAYWTGILLQLPAGWVYVYGLVKHRSLLGHSLETWYAACFSRCRGCLTAYGLFIWRYLNIPRNWEYVGSFWNIAVIVITLIPETVYPFLYIWVFNQNKSKVKRG
ncbi:hypothetical protein N7537_006791 [Penicillium hordei]|uniref:Uncharacterized protein n=1 Tax=Penicillium hordei TaxID=40994 RepID=A0AAD6H4R5_9EURO|nr:uncharacterized protein N7537_006791 [Penicillium hordei]KAJ5603835.1 hypothetical protein N7537_006791 [Penicillium hordei]